MVNIKKLKICLTVLIMVVTALAILCLVEWYPSRNVSPPREKTQYQLKIENDVIILYENGTPIREYRDIETENLPFEDRNNLKNGITFSTTAEAEKALEDYDG